MKNNLKEIKHSIGVLFFHSQSFCYYSYKAKQSRCLKLRSGDNVFIKIEQLRLNSVKSSIYKVSASTTRSLNYILYILLFIYFIDLLNTLLVS